MKKLWIAASAAGVLLACGGESGSSNAPPPAATQPAAPPAPAVTALSIGTPATVQYAGVAANIDAETAAQRLTLTIAQPGNYECRAHAEGRDAQMAMLQGSAELTRDSDSGGNFDALITRQLAPGTYELRVWEWQRRAGAIVVQCNPAPAAPAGTFLTLGAPVTVAVPAAAGPAGQRELTLSIAAQGTYHCDAHADGLDAQLSIVQNGAELQQDSDSGPGTDARISRDLAPGAYTVRVWEWMNRAANITVTCAPGPMPVE